MLILEAKGFESRVPKQLAHSDDFICIIAIAGCEGWDPLALFATEQFVNGYA